MIVLKLIVLILHFLSFYFCNLVHIEMYEVLAHSLYNSDVDTEDLSSLIEYSSVRIVQSASTSDGEEVCVRRSNFCAVLKEWLCKVLVPVLQKKSCVKSAN